MQKYKILTKRPLTTSIPESNSDMVSVNNYLINPIETQQELTSEYTVKDFLNDPKNSELATNFLSYLQNNTKDSEYKDILYNESKLSNLLNDYYNTTILEGTNPDKNKITSELEKSIEIYYENPNYSLLTDERKKDEKVEVTDLSFGDSFYISVLLKQNNRQIAPIKTSEFTKDKYENGILYTNGFVDLNNNTNAFGDI